MSARLDALQARTALYARHLPTGREVAIRADVPVNSLSVIKVPVMVAAFRAVEAGALDLDDRVLIEPDDLRGGGGLYEKMDPGLAPTYRDLITQMIIVSDNTATDLVVRRVGADAVNRLVDSLDYRETRLRMPTGDLFRELWLHTDSSTATLSGYDIFRRGFPSDVAAGERSFALEADSTRWLGRTTATTYCEGWSENGCRGVPPRRRPRRARPRAPRSGRGTATSGCVASGTKSDEMRYMPMSSSRR